MKLTAFTDYSLRVLIYLAADAGRRATISEIVSAFGVKENHLTKVVHFLGKRGWISTIRGNGGGIVLARKPHDIGVGQVVRDTEGMVQPAECFEAGGGNCAISGCCRLRGVLAEAVDAFYTVLDRYTLADLAGNPQAIVRVLGIQRAAAQARF
jgi:Rrf2 family transcriptional regulator, nitric oxide-sensitive transcriptional repressor